jgi:hypothetical protein
MSKKRVSHAERQEVTPEPLERSKSDHSFRKSGRWQDDWCLVRIRVTTRDRLRDVKRRRFSAYQSGRTKLEPSQSDGISDDAQVGNLIDRYEGHAERARRHRLKKRSSRAKTD